MIGLIPSNNLIPSDDLIPKTSVLDDLVIDYNTKYIQTAESITLEANRAKNAEELLSSRITLTAEEIKLEVIRSKNSEALLSSRITQTAEAITQEVTRAINAENILSGQISVLAGQVVLKTDGNGRIAAVALNSDASTGSLVKIKADNIQLEGLVTANGNFKILTDGSFEAVNAKLKGTINASSIYGSTINSSDIYGSTIYGSNFISTFTYNGNIASLIMNVNNIGWKDIGRIPVILSPTEAQIPTLKCQDIEVIGASRISVNSSMNVIGNLTVNDYNVIHSGNIGSQSVKYANEAGTAINANYASNAGYASTASIAYDAYEADYATNAGYATSAGYAESASSAPLSTVWRYAIVTNMNFLASQLGVSLPTSFPA